MTTSRDDPSNRLTVIAEPSGTTITFAYDANGQRDQQTVTTGGTTSQVNDTYQNGRLAVAILAAGHLLEVGAVDPWAITVSGINLFSSHIVLSTLGAELHDL